MENNFASVAQDNNGGIPLSSYSKAADAAGTMMVSSLLCGMLGIISSVVFTSYLGLGRITDAYFMAFSILMIFIKLFREGTFRNIYISLFSPLARKGSESDLRSTVNNFHSLTFIFFGVVVVTLILFCPMIAKAMAPGFDAITLRHTVNMARLLFPAMLYTALCSVLLSVYQSYSQFSLPAIIQIIPSLIPAIAALLFLKKAGAYSLVFAFLIGACIHLTILYIKLPLKGIKFNLRANPKSPQVIKFAKVLFPFYLSEVSMQGFLWVQNILSSLFTPGTVSVLALARKIRSYFVEYVLTPLPEIVYPSLTKSIKNKEKLQDLALKAITMSNFMILPIVIWFIVLIYPLVRIVFQRGYFDVEAVNKLAGFLAVFCLTLVMEGTNPILTKVLFAAQRTGWINIIRLAERLLDIILTLAFFKYFGFLGLAWAMVAGALVNFILACFFANKILKLKAIFTAPAFVKIIINCIFLFAATLFVNNIVSSYFNKMDIWHQGAGIVLVISVTALLYVALAYLFRIEESRIVFNLIKLKFTKHSPAV